AKDIVKSGSRVLSVPVSIIVQLCLPFRREMYFHVTNVQQPGPCNYAIGLHNCTKAGQVRRRYIPEGSWRRRSPRLRTVLQTTDPAIPIPRPTVTNARRFG